MGQGDVRLKLGILGNPAAQIGIDVIENVEGDIGQNDAEALGRVRRVLLININFMSGISLFRQFGEEQSCWSSADHRDAHIALLNAFIISVDIFTYALKQCKRRRSAALGAT